MASEQRRIREAAEQYLREMYAQRGDDWDAEPSYVRATQVNTLEQHALATLAGQQGGTGE